MTKLDAGVYCDNKSWYLREPYDHDDDTQLMLDIQSTGCGCCSDSEEVRTPSEMKDKLQSMIQMLEGDLERTKLMLKAVDSADARLILQARQDQDTAERDRAEREAEREAEKGELGV